ncbi:Protein of unknown function [Pseudorhodobacter antarcticus]|uniref:DUF1499 domain-containing protein n=1 Tax=Pseudorhodobacter antarcticus TaxID=1077947 RepID=A0A1H8DHW0_9RHOB|nr:DUF1499 domain-containing protein [Pseudorhodobacter antarcticus]SEN06840.1 Protein of unknown function [Pseudorhodobacter antarcticus]
MKVKSVSFFALVIAAAVVVLMAYIRLSPSDLVRWNVDPSAAFAPSDSVGQVITQTGGATLRLEGSDDLLVRLDAIAVASPRTQRLAGSVADGRITWITRSALWGFPDYTTAALKPDGLYINARLRFGKSDLGVNAARLRDWQTKL